MLLKLTNFLGVGPMLHPKQLPENMATEALDCFVSTGAITPVYDGVDIGASRLLPTTSGAQIKAMYKFGIDETDERNYWFTFSDDVDVVRGQIAGDTMERTYYTRGGKLYSTNATQAISGTSGAYPFSSSNLSDFIAPTTAPAATAVDRTISSVALDGTGVVVRIRFADKHALSVGQKVTISGADQSNYNREFSVARVVDDYTVEHDSTTTETYQANTASGSLYGYVGSKVSLASAAWSYNAQTGIVTVTKAGHGLSTGYHTITGMPFEIMNVVDAEITVTSTSSFHYTIPSAQSFTSSTNTLTIYPGKRRRVASASFLTKTLVTFADAHNFAGKTSINIITAGSYKGQQTVTPVENTGHDSDLAKQAKMEVPGRTGAATNLLYNHYQPNFPVESRLYIFTYVIKDTATGIERESGPSPATGMVDVYPGQDVNVTVSGTPSVAAGEQLWYRIYRTVAGAADPTFYYVTEINTSSFKDTLLAESLGEPCPSINYEPPPSGFAGLINLPNGIMAGFNGRDIYFCEPYRPHAWPSGYSLTVDYPIVGLGAYQNTLVILTTGYPYVAVGADPSSMTLQKVDLNQACVSKRSIVNFGHGVMYASPNGICYVGTQGAQLMTAGLFNYVTWNQYVGDPTTIHAYNYDGVYVGFYGQISGTKGGFMFDTRNQRQAFTKLSDWYTAGYFNGKNGNLYVAYQPNASTQAKIVKFNGIPTAPASPVPNKFYWQSKVFETPKPMNFSTAQVLCDDYTNSDVTLTVTADGVSETYPITSSKSIRLKSGFKARDWKFMVSGTKPVQSILIATSPTELQNG